MATKPWAIILMALCTLFTSFAQVLYKMGSKTLSFDIMSIITNHYIFIGLFLYFIAFVLMVKSFKGGEVTILYPIISTSYIWVGLLSIVFFNESITLLKWMGIFTIMSGIIFINLGNKAAHYTEAI
mgnify:CR=1 FL=1